MKEIINSTHPEWERFREVLRGVLSLADCSGSKNKPLSRMILENDFRGIDVPETMAYFELSGGYCDCEVLHNVRY